MRIITRKKIKNKKAETDKKRLIFDESIKIDKYFNPKDIPRHLVSFPSQYHFMSHMNIGKKKRKK